MSLITAIQSARALEKYTQWYTQTAARSREPSWLTNFQGSSAGEVWREKSQISQTIRKVAKQKTDAVHN